MVLNYIWIAFFLISFVIALIRVIFFHDAAIFPNMMGSAFSMAKTGFELSLYLTGAMSLWLGLMKVGEKAGVVGYLAKLVGPFFSKLFPEIPKNHPVSGSILMNITANMLGLDNAATPLGLKAMKELQELNPEKEKASNSMIMFLVINTAGLTLIPVSILVYRTQMGAKDPADVYIPILIATFTATLAGIISVSIFQKINLFNKVVLAYMGGLALIISTIIWFFSTLPQEKMNLYSTFAANFILFTIIATFITLGFIKKINVYDAFIEGAKEGFNVAVRIIPYLIAILVGIGVFRASGAMDFLIMGIGSFFAALGLRTDFVNALPVAFMKPLSGGGARGLMVDAMKTYGADSFVGRLSCIFQGATDTTFYVLAVYFGSVGIKKVRHAVACGLIADLAGVIAALLVAYLFFN